VTIKQRAQELIKSLPEEMTAEDLEIELSRLVEKLKVEEGLEASAQGNTISHEEVKQRMARWISE
jgi:predicted transcriptional regulator